MRKSDVETHREYNRESRPAINVKVYDPFPWAKLAAHFGVDRDSRELETAVQYCFESAQEQFWESAQDSLDFAFCGDDANGNTRKSGFTVYSEGRCGGWLVVDGMPDIETWDAIMLGKWAKFCRLIRSDIEYRTGFESMRDDIEANQWLKPGAEKYNFIDTDAGVRCVADLKAEARAAGFGPVVRR